MYQAIRVGEWRVLRDDAGLHAVHDGTGYEVPRMDSQWLATVKEKSWATEKTMRDLQQAIGLFGRPQAGPVSR